MRSFLIVTTITLIAAASAGANAQENVQATRTQVHDELRELVDMGDSSRIDETYYADGIQAAEAKRHAQTNSRRVAARVDEAPSISR